MLGAMLGGIGLAMRRVKRDADEIAPVHEKGDEPAVRLAHVAPNQSVRVIGVATPAAPLLESRFAGRPCVAYECVLVIVNDDNRTVESYGCCDFYLEDGGVRALVQGDFVVPDLVVRESGEWTSETLPAHVREWLMDATASDRWEHSRCLRWSEGRIEPGARVSVAGTPTLQVDDKGGDYRDSAELLTFGPTDDERVIICDEPELLTPPTS